MLLGAREQECLLFRERQPVMAATRSMVQHGGRFAIPFRERVGDPADVVKVAVNVQRTLGSKKIADDGDFVGARSSSEHCANGEADNFTYPHFDSFRSETRQISKIHTFQLQRGGRLRSIAPTYVDSFLELTLVLCVVEMAFRFADETVLVDLPKFVAADANAFSRAAGSGVGSR